MKKLFIFLASVFLCSMLIAPANAANKDTLVSASLATINSMDPAKAYDDSSANKDDRPLDANLGAGILFNINQSCSVSGKIGGIIGRKDYQEYNALLNLSFNF